MKKTTLALLVAGLFAAPSAFAQLKWDGSVSGTGIRTTVDSQNRFRFEEYRDLRSGVSAGVDLHGQSDTHDVHVFGENLGRDDQFIELKGGQYGAYKYSLYNQNIIHNLTFDAKTPFVGVGTNFLTFPGALGATPTTNTASWNRFDYRLKHENLGGTFEVKPFAASPLYVRTTANQKETNGIKPFGQAGTSPGGPNFELAMPVHYTTTDLSAEAGYSTKVSQYSVNVAWSRFRDHNDVLTWRNPAITGGTSTTTTERTTIAADNDLWKIGLNGLWRDLPLGSSFAVRGTYSRLANNIPIDRTFTSVTNPGGNTGVIRLANPSSNDFHGLIIYKSLSASLSSHLARNVDSRLYWNWTRKDNQSNQITFTPSGPGTGGTCDVNLRTGAAQTTCTTETFNYRKTNLGADLQYRVSPANKLGGGWDYTNTHRERFDSDRTTDNKLYVEAKNTSLENVTAKIKYQHLQRRSNFLLGDLDPANGATAGDKATIIFDKFLRRFDVADNDQDLVKVVLDATPMPYLDLGAEAIVKNNHFKNVVLGRNKDTRREVYLTASAGDPQNFRITSFFDIETTRYDSTHYQGTPNAATFPAAVNATTFLWNGRVKDKNYVLGLGAEMPVSGVFKVKGSWTWQKTDGTVDFSANNAAAVIINIPSYDSFHRQTLNLSGTYSVDKNFDVTLGAAHERFWYSDAQMNDYNLAPNFGGTQSFLSGAYANQNYTAWIGYLTLRYNIR